MLICFHDCKLDITTDVADHKEFSDRKRTYEVEGANVTGFFTGMIYLPLCRLLNPNFVVIIDLLKQLCVVDFTWKELQILRTKQRFPFRDQQYNGKYDFWC